MSIQKTITTIMAIAAISLGASKLAFAHGSSGATMNQPCGGYQGQMGPGMMGQGQMGPNMMMGPGMMGQGQMGPNMMMGPGMMSQGQMEPGMMGFGMMGQNQMGSGMIGQGQMGPGMMQPLRSDLSASDVQHMLEHRVAWQGNPNVKVGEVSEQDDDTITAEIVTKDGSLVQKLEVDRHTGWMRPAQ